MQSKCQCTNFKFKFTPGEREHGDVNSESCFHLKPINCTRSILICHASSIAHNAPLWVGLHKAPIEDPIKEPIEDSDKEPTKSIQESIKEPIKESIEEPIEEPIEKQIKEPIEKLLS